jgi:hypothetical protein
MNTTIAEHDALFAPFEHQRIETETSVVYRFPDGRACIVPKNPAPPEQVRELLLAAVRDLPRWR